MLLDLEQLVHNHCNIMSGTYMGAGKWEGVGLVGSWRQAKPSFRTVWTSNESKKDCLD